MPQETRERERKMVHVNLIVTMNRFYLFLSVRYSKPTLRLKPLGRAQRPETSRTLVE